MEHFPFDVVVLSFSFVAVFLQQDFNSHVIAYILCGVVLLCSFWTEGRIGSKNPKHQTSSCKAFLQNLREAKSSGSWYGVLPLLAVAAEASGKVVGGSLWLPDVYFLSISLTACVLFLGRLTNIFWDHTFLLIASLSEMALIFSTLYLHGYVWCSVAVVAQILSITILWLCVMWGWGCFTLGEALVVAQIYNLFLYRAVRAIFQGYSVVASKPVETQSHFLAAVVFLSLTLIIMMLLIHRRWYSQGPGPVVFYSLHIIMAVGVVLPFLYYSFNRNPVIWLLQYILEKRKRLLLFLWWLVLSAVTVCTVLYYGTKSGSSTITRKAFHIVVVAVYVPGLLMDTSFLNVASVIALALLIVLEVVRVFNIPPLGTPVHDLFKVFCDEKDRGPVIVSHIYLLLGLSVPIWLAHSSSSRISDRGDISLFSGVISLGIGDTAASVGGSIFGRHKWPGSKKTLEGTTIAVFCQLVSIACLSYLGMEVPYSTWTVVAIVIVTSVLEGVMAQIDNLILPLFMYMMFVSATSYM